MTYYAKLVKRADDIHLEIVELDQFFDTGILDMSEQILFQPVSSSIVAKIVDLFIKFRSF